MSDKKNNSGLAPEKKELIKLHGRAFIRDKVKQPWKVWAFVIGLNVAGLLGALYLQSKGINVFAFR